MLERKGDITSAETLYRRALTVAHKSLPVDHPQMTYCLFTLGRFLIDHGQQKEGELLVRKELEIVEGSYGEVSASVAERLRYLGDFVAGTGRIEEGSRLLRRAIKIYTLIFGSEHEDVMAGLSALGNVFRCASRLDDAEKELGRAVELAGKLDFGGPFFSFAELRIDQKRYKEAEKLLQRCLEIRRRKLEPEDEAICETIRKLADVYRLMGREAEAEEILKQLRAKHDGTS